ncbi:hypothetical protein BN1080_02144 [Planococcus massiliensis]|uniref:DUF2178 domain-containing protein n=1 Tax=Planococcus massiliensis TaxID=1499687 RepID=A0A098EN29_9BACL|nr:hypothetical protein [Planococcus massiliensis]CEG23197.1 hypothetical protein BN1080_02144 [Planococcus massiliensis]
MKNDFRLNYPLWMMAFILLLGVLAFGLNSPITEFVNTEKETSFTIKLEALEGFIVFFSIIIYFAMLVIFMVRLKKHNKENPTQKISPLAIRPPEYLEQDEGMTYITRKAVQKVYSFITLALPLLATLVIFLPVPKLLIIYGILAIAFGQYLIYYLEVRKHFKEETE